MRTMDKAALPTLTRYIDGYGWSYNKEAMP